MHKRGKEKFVTLSEELGIRCPSSEWKRMLDLIPTLEEAERYEMKHLEPYPEFGATICAEDGIAHLENIEAGEWAEAPEVKLECKRGRPVGHYHTHGDAYPELSPWDEEVAEELSRKLGSFIMCVGGLDEEGKKLIICQSWREGEKVE